MKIGTILTMVISMIVGYNIGRAYEVRKRSPEDGASNIRIFEAKLIRIPDHHKQMQWLAVPVGNTWNDSILIDFDLGGSPPLGLKSGDVVPVVGEEKSNKWIYWHEVHWLERKCLGIEG